MKENKLIAEFMGLIESSIDKKYWTEKTKEGIGKGELVELKYHTSWDWLMPVIQKCLIGEAEQSEEISNLAIKNIYEGICNQDISLAYQSVVQFINNKNKRDEK